MTNGSKLIWAHRHAAAADGDNLEEAFWTPLNDCLTENSSRDEYRLYRQALQDEILTRPDWADVALKTILAAREKALALLKANIPRQQAAV